MNSIPPEDEASSSRQQESKGQNFIFEPEDLNPPVRTRLRFKADSQNIESQATDAQRQDKKHSRSRHHGDDRKRKAHRRKHRQHRSKAKARDHSASPSKPSSPENSTYKMDTETAFRESLFDAMADDEGAAFWEGVYGQPIHHYPNVKAADPSDPTSKLEKMSDEEYTAYVRDQMWQKTHQHIVEEREKREAAAQQRREEAKRTRAMEDERATFNKKVEESLRRGEERRRERLWRDAWADYSRKWETLLRPTKVPHKAQEAVDARPEEIIPWPNRYGRQTNISKDEVETFFKHAPNRGTSTQKGLRELLKQERVRWHPDKMQHRFGASKLNEDTLKAVVAVFQVVDDMWAKASS